MTKRISLTTSQEVFFLYLVGFLKEHHRQPTFREAMRDMCWASLNAPRLYLSILSDKGWIEFVGTGKKKVWRFLDVEVDVNVNVKEDGPKASVKENEPKALADWQTCQHEFGKLVMFHEPDFGVVYGSGRKCLKCGAGEIENWAGTRASGGTPYIYPPFEEGMSGWNGMDE